MRITKLKAFIAAGVLAVAGAGGAFALWSSGGSGNGGAKALTAQTLTVTTSSGAADLFPGFTQGDLFFTMANPNPYPVTFTSMTAGTVTSGDPTNCPSSNVTVANATGLSLAVAAGAASAPGTVANVVTMLAGAPDGCQGVVFTVTLTLTGSQS